MSLKEKLFASKPDKPVLHPIKFMGEDCYYRVWSERERIEWAVSFDDNDPHIASKCLAWWLCDEHGNNIFERADYEKIAELPTNEVQGAAVAILELQKPKQQPKKKSKTPQT